MKILHCCLAAFYIDNYGYQENILPKMHNLQGYEVAIVASTETYLDNKSLGYLKSSSYKNEDDIPVTRIPYISRIPKTLARKLRIYSGLEKIILEFKPDIIFMHDTQFLSIKTIVKYAKQYPNVVIYADGHTDFINSARGWVSKNILHKIIYKYCAKIVEPYVKKFYGTLPSRVEFISNVYGISNSKIKLLELGADDSSFDISKKDVIRRKTRKDLNINETDFVVISGGKIDKRKNIEILVNAFKTLSNKDVKLILFGAPNDEMNYLISEIENFENIIYLGWQKPSEIYNLLFASDLGFFPGTHSVLWEQSCGVGLPCVFKRWENMQHVDLGGNCIFMDDVNVKLIQDIILYLRANKEDYFKMQKVAIDKCINHFSYSNIAKRAIDL